MAKGTIKQLRKDRGFGSIQVEDSTKEVFFHHSSVSGASFDDLQVDQSVEFETEVDSRDPTREGASPVRLGE